ncbi:hypothetical protein [Paludisphaera borealis]|uniref:hypothetical protein n=1 Tax=Paludisphaera borealis TaxID=1387353 RepID=UPI0011AB753E|nr:hypothetical protein [Paludisphaera borealis]
MTRTKEASPALMPAWARVLASIGGREETLVLIGLGDTHDPALLDSVYNSAMFHSHWPGLLPPLRRWLDDPVIAPFVLRYSLLTRSSEGREFLLAYAVAKTHPLVFRRQAVERLLETIPGTKLLLNAVEDHDSFAVLAATIDGDLRETFRAAMAKLEDRNGEALWTELIEAVDSIYPNRFPIPTTAMEKSASVAESRRRFIDDSNLLCLEWITGRTDVRSQAEWRRWYESTQPSPLSQRDIVKLALEHPETLNVAAILRRIVPYHLGPLPADCIPLYERMARDGPPASQFWACTALLLCTPKTDAVPIVIDLIDQKPADDLKPRNWGPIELLQWRFAENFDGDTAAWRRWWTEFGRQP